MNKKSKNAIESMRKLANSLSGDAKEVVEQFVAYAEGLEADEATHELTELQDKFAELVAAVAKQNEEVAERISKLKNELMAMVGGSKSVADKFTADVRNEIAKALVTAKSKQDAIAQVFDIAEKAGVEVKRTKNDVTGIEFGDIVDYALQIKQDESDDIFDALRKTARNKFYYAELDGSNAAAIAKQWNGRTDTATEKAVQELALEGKRIDTKYVYKRQRLDNEDLDDAEENGQLAALENDIRAELRKAVKALAVKSILVGDTINGNGQKVTTFETIGAKTTTDVFTTIVAPATAGSPIFADFRKAADAVKTDKKWLFVSSAVKAELIKRPAGADTHFYTDAELAAQLGVDKVVVKDYIAEVEGVHGIVIDPNEYWVKERKTIDVAFPEYKDNTRNYLYEINMGGAIHGLKSTAVLREA